jgi:hypothetical protein
MSRRRDRRQTGDGPDRPGRPDRPEGGDRSSRAAPPDRPGRSDRSSPPGRPDRGDRRSGPPNRRLRAGIVRDVAILVAAFAIGVGAAELFGAANVGVAFGVGQVVFALTLIVVLTRE